MEKDFIDQNMTLKNKRKISAIKLAQHILEDANDYNGLIMVGDAINYVLKLLAVEPEFKVGEINPVKVEIPEYKFKIGDIVKVTSICPGMPHLKPIVEKGEVVELPSELDYRCTGKKWYRVKTREYCHTYTEDKIELIRREPL